MQESGRTKAMLCELVIVALFLALSYLLFDPVRALLADRQQRIAQELEGAKAQMEEARRQPPGIAIRTQPARCSTGAR